MTRTIRSAWVVARRDFVAVIYSKTFLFFLLGPLFPIVVGGLAGGIGAQVASSVNNPQLGVAMVAADTDAFIAAHRTLRGRMAGDLPELVVLERVPSGATFDARAAMGQGRERLAAVVSGTLDRPHLTGTAERVERWQGVVATLAATAKAPSTLKFPPVATTTIATSAAKLRNGRLATAQAGQTILFLLTMLLAGMVLCLLPLRVKLSVS